MHRAQQLQGVMPVDYCPNLASFATYRQAILRSSFYTNSVVKPPLKPSTLFRAMQSMVNKGYNPLVAIQIALAGRTHEIWDELLHFIFTYRMRLKVSGHFLDVCMTAKMRIFLSVT